MDSFLNQMPALVGVVVGTLSTLVATTLIERGKWARRQSVRWDERRLDAYTAYARSLKEVHAVATGMTAARRPGSLTPAIGRQDGLDRLSRANAQRTVAWEDVLLLGDTATVTAAREWREAVARIEHLARVDDASVPAWPDAARVANERRDAFYRAARHSLAVDGGSVDQAAWMDERRNRRQQSTSPAPK